MFKGTGGEPGAPTQPSSCNHPSSAVAHMPRSSGFKSQPRWVCATASQVCAGACDVCVTASVLFGEAGGADINLADDVPTFGACNLGQFRTWRSTSVVRISDSVFANNEAWGDVGSGQCSAHTHARFFHLLLACSIQPRPSVVCRCERHCLYPQPPLPCRWRHFLGWWGVCSDVQFDVRQQLGGAVWSVLFVFVFIVESDGDTRALQGSEANICIFLPLQVVACTFQPPLPPSGSQA